MKVFKFGGASVQNADAIRNVTTILQGYKEEELVIVISAMGKTTNALERVLDGYFESLEKGIIALETVRKAHHQTIESLFDGESEIIKAEIQPFFDGITAFFQSVPTKNYDFYYDQIVSVGEMLSTKIVSAYLQKEGVINTWQDVRQLIATDATFREAKVNWEQTEKQVQDLILPLLDKGLVVTQGFIGSEAANNTTTLGREGSDYTTAILAYCLNAESMSVWKNVPGILTADPRLFKNVTKLDRLSYQEAIEMTYYGAKVIHPKTIKPIQNKNIPLFVKSFLAPKEAGTVISDMPVNTYPPVVVVMKEQILLHISRRDFSFVTEDSLGELFGLFNEHRVKVNLMQNTAISFSICTDNKPRRIKGLLAALKANYQVVKDEKLELITIRHYRDDYVATLKKGKIVLLEERVRQTLQMIVRDVPMIERRFDVI